MSTEAGIRTWRQFREDLIQLVMDNLNIHRSGSLTDLLRREIEIDV
jgi:hypothetical protein